MKRCYRCGRELPSEDFYRHPGMASGRLNKCKTCCKEQAKVYRVEWIKNKPDKYAAALKRGGEWSRIKRQDARLNPEEKAALAPIRAAHAKAEQDRRNREYRERHREELHLKRVLHRDSRFTPEEQAVYRAGYRREQRRVWALAHPEKQRAWGIARRAREMGAAGHATARQIQARWDFYGRTCWMCGAPATDTDHVIPLNRGGSHWPANLRPACQRCNRAKSDRDHREFVGVG